MGCSFDEAMWRADLLALAERALDFGFQRLYDLMIADGEWDLYAVQSALRDLAAQVPALAEQAREFASDID